MALNKQNLSVSFTQGVDTKTDSKQVAVGKLLLLENGIFQTPLKIRKRNGSVKIADIDSGKALATYNQELLAFDGSQVFSFSESNLLMTNKGNLTSIELSLTPVVRNSFQQTVPDMAEHSSGLQIFTWTDTQGSGGTRYSIVDSFTGESLVTDVLLSVNAIKAKPFALGAYLVIIYANTSNNNLEMVSIPVVSPSSPSSPVTVATDLNVANRNFDGSFIGSKLYLAWNNSDGGGGITLKDINIFLVISSPVVVTGEAASVAISVFGDSSNSQVWVAYYNGTDVKYFVRNSSLGAVLAPTNIETVANVVRVGGLALSGAGRVWYEISAVATYNHFIKTNSITNTGTVGTPSVFLRSVGLIARPFYYNGVNYIPVTFESVQQPTVWVVAANGTFIAKAIQGNGGGLLTTSALPNVVSIESGIFNLPLLQKDLLTTISGNIYTQTGMVYIALNFVSTSTYQTTELAANLHITGAQLDMYDGASITEHGFNVYPENITFTQGAGGSLSVGQYQYSVTYEWTDNQGQIHRSFPSIPTTVTVIGAGDNQVTLTIPTLRLTEKSNVLIVIYRTEANGTVFHQITSVTAPLRNNPAVDTVTYIDSAADTAITGNPILYTTGGVLGNDQAPASIASTFYKDRLILIPADSRQSFWYSKQVVPGTPVEFSADFVENIDPRGGDVTATEQLDDKLILFKTNFIFALTGDGPDSTGAQNDFSEPQLVTADGGCIDINSVVLMPAGIMYKSNKGIYLLDRSLTVDYIGAPVEAFNSIQINSAQLITKTNQVRFSLVSGQILVFDYYMQQWSVFTNQNAVDTAMFQDELTIIQSNGQILQENPDVFTDNNEFIKLKLTTSWVSFAGLQGFQRIYRLLLLGEYISPHQLMFSVSYDFDTTIQQQDLVNAGALFDLTAYGEDSPYGNEEFYGGQVPFYTFRFDFRRQKCTSVQFTIEDVQNQNFGEGLSLSAFNLMVGMKQGSNKLQPAKIYA